MPDPMLQKRYCVAAVQQRVSYNVIMSLPSSHQGCEPAAVAAIAPVLAAVGNRARIEFLPRGSVLMILAVALILAAVLWARQCFRAGVKVPDRPAEWQQPHPGCGPRGEQDGPLPWQ
jgi:hypothetical protein